MTGCSEDLTSSGSDDEIKPGDPVLFAPYLSGRAMTRATDVSTYKDATQNTDITNYTFTYEMYKSSAVLVASGLQIYWPDNQIAYAFKATAGSETLATDQDSYEDFLLQDKLEGYGAIASTTDNIEDLNYRISKNWKADNGGSKAIPIYLKHLRSRITVILKAGEGVSRQDLILDYAENFINAKIYSYSGETTTEISPYATSTTIDYTAGDYGGAANGVSTTQYTAIVEPYDYQTNSTKPIAQIKLSNQTFKFLVGNESVEGNKSYYNLSAGQHLTITATLSRGSDGNIYQVKMAAQVTDWDVTDIAATMDSEGQIGTTTDIGTRAALLTFLTSENNKAGNIANITESINLEDGGAWTSQPLNCTMKMNDKTFTTTHRIFSTIGVGGKLVGGTISVGGDGTVDAAIAGTNRGTIQNITVNRTSTAKATIAGLVVTNSGTISSCISNLPVYGASDVVGGIVMESVYHSDNGSMPVIEGCIANARVEGSGETVGGGIVGKAVGRVSGNTFNYGITLLQEADKFKNIVYGKPDAETHELRAYSNSWPTTAANTIGNHSSNNSNTMAAANIFDATIDSQTELATLLNNVYNIGDRKYRVSDNFSVTGSWGYSGTTANFTLNGNSKTITSYFNPLFQNASTACTDLTITYTNLTP